MIVDFAPGAVQPLLIRNEIPAESRTAVHFAEGVFDHQLRTAQLPRELLEGLVQVTDPLSKEPLRSGVTLVQNGLVRFADGMLRSKHAGVDSDRVKCQRFDSADVLDLLDAFEYDAVWKSRVFGVLQDLAHRARFMLDLLRDFRALSLIRPVRTT